MKKSLIAVTSVLALTAFSAFAADDAAKPSANPTDDAASAATDNAPTTPTDNSYASPRSMNGNNGVMTAPATASPANAPDNAAMQEATPGEGK